MVKCVDCGYLAVRNLHNRTLAEAESLMRQRGESPPHPGDSRWKFYETGPVCFVLACDLPREAGNADDKGKFLDVIGRERECNRHTPWQQGFTPREHKEMLDEKEERKWRAEEERRNKEYRDKKDENDRKYREETDKENAAWRLRQETESRRQSRSQLWIAGVAIAIVTAGIVCVTQLLCTSWQIADARTGRSSSSAVQPDKK